MYVCVSYKMYDVNAGRYIYKRTSLQDQDSVTTDVMVTDLFSISFFLRSQLWWLLPLMPSVKMVWNKTERLVCGTKDSRYPRMRYEISSAVGRGEEKESFVTCRQGLLVGPNNVGHYHRTHEKIVYSFAYQY